MKVLVRGSLVFLALPLAAAYPTDDISVVTTGSSGSATSAISDRSTARPASRWATRDGIVSVGLDRVWVDDIALTGGVPI